jgi:two-component system sensor histidine kinase DesK
MRLLPGSSHLGWTPYAWLVYLSFFVVYAVIFNDSAIDWTIDGAALAVFLVLYFRGFWSSGAALGWIIAGIVALGVLLSPRNPGASTFFIYGAAFLGEFSPPARAVRGLIVIVAIIAIEAWVVPLRPEAWIPGIVISLLIGGTNIHFAEVRRRDVSLLKAQEAAEYLAKIAERERIARDLHDLLGHTLSLIVLKSELAAKLAERAPDRAMSEIRDVERISRQALAEVRRALQGYRGERLHDELASGRDALAAAGVELHTKIAPVALAPEDERALALAVREAITNVIRHARARHCTITLALEDGATRLTIEDDGVGGGQGEGAGLTGMRARMAELGGAFERDTTRGTRLTLIVPDRRRALAAS